MSRRFQISILLMAALAIALAVALRAVFGQQKTIADLRAQIENRLSASTPDALPGPLPNELPATQAPEPSAGVPTPHAAAVAPQAPAPANAELVSLPQQTQSLSTKLAELEQELAQTKRLVPEPEEPAAAYVGPGTWINANGQTRGITKIVISGEARSHAGFAPTMKITAWGRCSPTDCEWGEVPFFLLNVLSSETTYRRGFAVWDSEGWSRYVTVVFEKSGLKVECISVGKQQSIPPRRDIEAMMRTN